MGGPTSRGEILIKPPVTALVAGAMNDVLNSQGYAQAAWWNQMPTSGVDADVGDGIVPRSCFPLIEQRSLPRAAERLVVGAIISIALFSGQGGTHFAAYRPRSNQADRT